MCEWYEPQALLANMDAMGAKMAVLHVPDSDDLPDFVVLQGPLTLEEQIEVGRLDVSSGADDLYATDSAIDEFIAWAKDILAQTEARRLHHLEKFMRQQYQQSRFEVYGVASNFRGRRAWSELNESQRMGF